MSPRLKPDEARLLTLAREQAETISDPEVRACWEVLLGAISERWIVPEGRMSLQELIDGLEQGLGAGAEEYAIDVDDEDVSKVVAVFVGDRHRCPREAMMRELLRLEARRRGEPEPERPPPPSPEVPPDPGTLRGLVQLLLGARSQTLPDSEEAARLRAEVRDGLAELGSAPEALASDDVRQTLAGLTDEDRATMASALRTFADWAERPERGGAAVDDVIRLLESTLLGRLARGGPAEERATQERIAQTARDAIARRLRGGGGL
jgi:hypothetical protein